MNNEIRERLKHADRLNRDERLKANVEAMMPVYSCDPLGCPYEESKWTRDRNRRPLTALATTADGSHAVSTGGCGGGHRGRRTVVRDEEIRREGLRRIDPIVLEIADAAFGAECGRAQEAPG